MLVIAAALLVVQVGIVGKYFLLFTKVEIQIFFYTLVVGFAELDNILELNTSHPKNYLNIFS